MKNNKQDELLQILSESSHSVSSTALAGMLGVSERTVRNYIKEINSGNGAKIISSRDGYRLENASYKKKSSKSESELRMYRILSDLLTNKEGINAFDEAESLFVSPSTVINTILPRIKGMIREYDLYIESQKYQFVLKGSEQNKRRLIGHIATYNSYGFFSSKEALEQLFPDRDIYAVMQRLYQICQDSGLFLNDYALNNLLIHILVILIRLESDNELEAGRREDASKDLLAESPAREQIAGLADLISFTFEQEYHIHIPEHDYQQLLVLIALSVEHETTDISSIVSQEFTASVASCLSMLSRRYCTPEFTGEFARQFSLHMYYAMQRYAFRVSYPNPIGGQFKKDYAPIFDMAVYFAHKFSKIHHVEFNEDELAFIAFHLGAYLETAYQNRKHISCVIVTESYHLNSTTLLRELENHFPDQLTVMDVLPLNRYLERRPECELIITTLPLATDCRHTILVNPFLTKQNINSIRAALEEIHSEKEQSSVRAFLRKLLHEELYFRNLNLETAEDYIRYLGQHCLKHGYVNEAFIQDVLLRESVSCTAFTNTLAVPHAISQYAEKSFICVVHNDMPIQWNHKKVQFIFMIGITEQEMKYFKNAFDIIIELFSSAGATLEILKTDTFEDFCEKLVNP